MRRHHFCCNSSATKMRLSSRPRSPRRRSTPEAVGWHKKKHQTEDYSTTKQANVQKYQHGNTRVKVFALNRGTCNIRRRLLNRRELKHFRGALILSSRLCRVDFNTPETTCMCISQQKPRICSYRALRRRYRAEWHGATTLFSHP